MRRLELVGDRSDQVLNQSPVQKGIETGAATDACTQCELNQSPVQKGIETKDIVCGGADPVEPEPRSEGD